MAALRLQLVVMAPVCAVLLVVCSAASAAPPVYGVAEATEVSDEGAGHRHIAPVAYQERAGGKPVYARASVPDDDAFAPSDAPYQMQVPIADEAEEMEGVYAPEHYLPQGNCGSCGGCGCQPCRQQPQCGGCGCCNCRPVWTVEASAVYLHRAELDDAVILQEFGTLATVASASDFDLGWEPGVDVSVKRRLPCGCLIDAIGARYLGVNQWDDSFPLFLPNGNNLPLGVSPFGTFGNNNPQNWLLSYESELQSMEVNAYRDLRCGVTLLAGARYIRLDEQLTMDATTLPPAPLQTSTFTFETENDLYGFQVGAMGPLVYRRCLHIDALIKAGIYVNDASHDATLIILGAGANQFGASERDTQLAFLGELGAAVTYDFSRHLSVRLGYQCFWVSGVAIAGDQVGATDLVTQTGINTNGDALYHGATAGLIWTR